jgi:hypothetical protein
MSDRAGDFMKIGLIALLALGSMSVFSAERVACNISESIVTENESLVIIPSVEIVYPAGNLDFNSLNGEFTTKSLFVNTSKLSKRELLVSARLTDNGKKVRVLEFKVHQKHNNKHTEISRSYYRLGYEELGIRHESIYFSFIIPRTQVFLTFECSKY